MKLAVAIFVCIINVIFASLNKKITNNSDVDDILGEYEDFYDISSKNPLVFGVYRLLVGKNQYPPGHVRLSAKVGSRIFRMQDDLESMVAKYMTDTNVYLKRLLDANVSIAVVKILGPLHKEIVTALDPDSMVFDIDIEDVSQKELSPGQRNAIRLFISTLNTELKQPHKSLRNLYREKSIATSKDFVKISNIINNASRDIGNQYIFNPGNFSKQKSKEIFNRQNDSNFFENTSAYVCSWINHLILEKARIEMQNSGNNMSEIGLMTYNSINVFNHILDLDINALFKDFNARVTKKVPLSVGKKISEITKTFNTVIKSEEIISFIYAASSFSQANYDLGRIRYFEFMKKKIVQYGITVRTSIIALLEKKVATIINQVSDIKKYLTKNNIQSDFIDKIIKKAEVTLLVHNIKLREAIVALEEKNLLLVEDANTMEKTIKTNQEYDLCNSKLLNLIDDMKVKVAAGYDEVMEELVSILAQAGVNVRRFKYKYLEEYETFSQYLQQTLKLVGEVAQEFEKSKVKSKIKINSISELAIDKDKLKNNTNSVSELVIKELEEETNVFPTDSSPSDEIFSKSRRVRIADYENMSRLCLNVPEMASDRRSVERRDRLRIATFNTQWLFPFPREDGSYVRESMESARDHLRSITRVISELDADIIFLQEVQDCRALQAMAALMEKHYGLEGYQSYLLESGDETLGQHVGILTRIDPTELKYIDTENGEESSVVAKNLFARFTVLNENRVEFNLALVGFHLISGEYPIKRSRQANSIVQFINSEVADTENLIVLGDMNDYDPSVFGHAPYSDALTRLSLSKNKTRNIS